jgi:hypothetical protein
MPAVAPRLAVRNGVSSAEPGDEPVEAAMVAGWRHLVMWDDVTEWIWWRSLTEQEKAEAQASEQRCDLLRDVWAARQLGYTVGPLPAMTDGSTGQVPRVA